MKKPKVIYQKADNNNISEQKSSSYSRFHLVLHRLFFKKKDILGLYSYKLRVFLKALLSRRCSNNGNNYIRNSRNIRVAGITSSFLLVLLSISIIIPLYNDSINRNAEATTGTSKQSDTVLTLDTSQSVAAVDLLVKDSNGTFATSSDTSRAKYTVTTNNYTGYTLTITNKSNSTDLVNNDVSSSNGESSNTFTSISSTISSTTFDTTTYNGKWGYMPSRYCTSTTISSCTNNTNYRPSPTTTASTLDITNTPNTTAKEYTIGIGARATYTQQAGVYSNTYILQAVGNPINYAITYSDASGDSSVTPTLPSTTSGSTSATSITLSSDTPTRSGYEFKGWCGVNNSPDTSACKDSSGNTGTIYQPGATYGIDQTTTNVTTLYAVWEAKIPMQNLSSSTCTTTPMQVYDTRDSQTYTVQKLADGNCWLLENLRLNLTDSTVLAALTTSNTNIDTTNTPDALDYLRGIKTGASSDRYAMSKVANWTSTSYTYSAPWIAVDSTTSGKCENASYCTGGSALTWSSTDSTSLANNGADKYPGKVGIYYNYCAATAGTYCYGNGTNYGSPSGNATSDICPAGWRMPTGGSSGEYQALYAAYSNNYASFRSAFQVPLSGFFHGGTARTQGGESIFWSSTYYSIAYMYSLYISTGSAYPAINDSHGQRHYGNSVRCILKPNYTVQFNPNNGTGTMNDQVIPTDTATALNSNTFTRDGYAFTGWNTKADGSGTTYTDGASVTNLTTSGNTITLYAQWEEIIYMQDITISTCAKNVGTNGNSANIGDTIKVYDRRDNSDYTVRYINGACWMTQNLRITHTTDQPEGTILGTDSDFSATSVAMTNGTGFSDYTVAQYHGPTASDLSRQGDKYTADQVGVWYSFCAAAAKSGAGACDNSSNYSGSESICPSGWELPTRSQLNDIISSATAFSPIYGGSWQNSSLYDATAQGRWWSSTVSTVKYQYYLYYSNGGLGVISTGGGNKNSGSYVRCVKTNDGYMQDTTVDMLEEGEERTLADKRDNNTYAVKKINGALWMIQNLRITGTISAEYSNFTGDNVNISEDDLVSGNSYDQARTHTGTDDNGNPTVWYNFCAASAKNSAGCSDSARYTANTDICPSGWRLPTESEFYDISFSVSEFNPTHGGFYNGGSLDGTGDFGFWWSSTSLSWVQQSDMVYMSNGALYTGRNYKTFGFYIRCVRTS